MIPKEINNIVDLVKKQKWPFWSKSDENLLTKATHSAKVANFFFEMGLCYVWLKDQIKILKITILSSHALPEKIM